eukprot:GILK01013274.1.p1 GENE.GILK01013274.1~~GILK01013274.1.p1  ORF type:complete len:1019 (-),score=166.36 GILK01013274.1:92-2788(-)
MDTDSLLEELLNTQAPWRQAMVAVVAKPIEDDSPVSSTSIGARDAIRPRIDSDEVVQATAPEPDVPHDHERLAVHTEHSEDRPNHPVIRLVSDSLRMESTAEQAADEVQSPEPEMESMVQDSLTCAAELSLPYAASASASHEPSQREPEVIYIDSVTASVVEGSAVEQQRSPVQKQTASLALEPTSSASASSSAEWVLGQNLHGALSTAVGEANGDLKQTFIDTQHDRTDEVMSMNIDIPDKFPQKERQKQQQKQQQDDTCAEVTPIKTRPSGLSLMDLDNEASIMHLTPTPKQSLSQLLNEPLSSAQYFSQVSPFPPTVPYHPPSTALTSPFPATVPYTPSTSALALSAMSTTHHTSSNQSQAPLLLFSPPVSSISLDPSATSTSTPSHGSLPTANFSSSLERQLFGTLEPASIEHQEPDHTESGQEFFTPPSFDEQSQHETVHGDVPVSNVPSADDSLSLVYTARLQHPSAIKSIDFQVCRQDGCVLVAVLTVGGITLWRKNLVVTPTTNESQDAPLWSVSYSEQDSIVTVHNSQHVPASVSASANSVPQEQQQQGRGYVSLVVSSAADKLYYTAVNDHVTLVYCVHLFDPESSQPTLLVELPFICNRLIATDKLIVLFEESDLILIEPFPESNSEPAVVARLQLNEGPIRAVESITGSECILVQTNTKLLVLDLSIASVLHSVDISTLLDDISNIKWIPQEELQPNMPDSSSSSSSISWPVFVAVTGTSQGVPVLLVLAVHEELSTAIELTRTTMGLSSTALSCSHKYIAVVDSSRSVSFFNVDDLSHLLTLDDDSSESVDTSVSQILLCPLISSPGILLTNGTAALDILDWSIGDRDPALIPNRLQPEMSMQTPYKSKPPSHRRYISSANNGSGRLEDEDRLGSLWIAESPLIS